MRYRNYKSINNPNGLTAGFRQRRTCILINVRLSDTEDPVNTTWKSLLAIVALASSAATLSAQRAVRQAQSAARIAAPGQRVAAKPNGSKAQRRMIRAQPRAGLITSRQAKRQLRRARRLQRVQRSRTATRTP